MFHEARRHGPKSVSRFDRAAARQNFVFPFRDAAHNHSRVLIMNDVALAAHEARQRVAFGYSQFNGGAAIAAKLQSRIRIKKRDGSPYYMAIALR